MSSISASGLLERRGLRVPLAARFSFEAPVIVVLAMFVTCCGVVAPYMLAGDGWLTLLGGREIAQHGIPGSDPFAILSHGRTWLDQQWLAQLAIHRLERAAGLAVTVGIVCVLQAVPFVLAVVLARRRGASPRSVALFAFLCSGAFFCAVRAQIFSELLFLPLLLLLVRESRSPTRRVWLAFPVLILWANLHGAALVAASLVSVLGLAELVQGRPRPRAIALLVLPPLTLLATPYGLGLVGYYRSTMANPYFPAFISEWSPPVLKSVIGFPFYATAALVVVLAARRARDLTLFEHGALALTLLGALVATRSIPWFSYAALLLAPVLLEREWPQLQLTAVARRMLGTTAAFAVVFAVCFCSVQLSRLGGLLPQLWPADAVQTVRAALAADPSARVLAGQDSADWLLYEIPELRGRLAFDGRWEILAPQQFRDVRNYLFPTGSSWEAPSRGYRIIVLSPRTNRELVRTYLRRGLRVLYRGDRVVVFERPYRPKLRSLRRMSSAVISICPLSAGTDTSILHAPNAARYPSEGDAACETLTQGTNGTRLSDDTHRRARDASYETRRGGRASSKEDNRGRRT